MSRAKAMASALMFATVSACSSVTPIQKYELAGSGDSCHVDVYWTHDQALQNGPIEELCVITGTSSGSFSHTVKTAIEKRHDDICACGATAVYVRSQSQTWWEVATVDMVVFRYLDQPSATTTR